MMASAAVAPVPARAAAAGAYPERAGSHRLRDPVAAMADRAAALTAFRPARDWYLLLLGGDQRARLRIPKQDGSCLGQCDQGGHGLGAGAITCGWSSSVTIMTSNRP